MPDSMSKYHSDLSSAVLVHVQRPVHGDEGSNSGSHRNAAWVVHHTRRPYAQQMSNLVSPTLQRRMMSNVALDHGTVRWVTHHQRRHRTEHVHSDCRSELSASHSTPCRGPIEHHE